MRRGIFPGLRQDDEDDMHFQTEMPTGYPSIAIEADPFYAAYRSSIRSTRWQLSWLALLALTALSSLTCLAALTALALAACLGECQPL